MDVKRGYFFNIFIIAIDKKNLGLILLPELFKGGERGKILHQMA